jgi:cytochrome c peroxidase
VKIFGSHTILFVVLASVFVIQSCNPDDDGGTTNPLYDDTPYVFERPFRFPVMEIPANNPLTLSKIALGRMLFYDPIISKDSTTSCASCHNPQFNFTDNGLASSTNALGVQTTRISMPLINLAWSKNFFWDGRETTLEGSVLDALINEQHPNYTVSFAQMKQNEMYETAFAKAYQNAKIDETNIVNALASFIRILYSKDSKFDAFYPSLSPTLLAESEYRGYNLFISEQADCFHCHGTYPNFTSNLFHNNGLQQNITNPNQFLEKGLGLVTGNINDYGKIKAPSLRNLAYSAPYMHDGRFQTLDEVIEFYSSGVTASPNLDPNMKFVAQGGVQLLPEDKQALKDFLLTLTDETFINNPEFSSPF